MQIPEQCHSITPTLLPIPPEAPITMFRSIVYQVPSRSRRILMLMRRTAAQRRRRQVLSICIIEKSSLDLDFDINILRLLSRAVPAGMGVSDLEPPGISGVEVADEQHAWNVEVCVCVSRMQWASK